MKKTPAKTKQYAAEVMAQANGKNWNLYNADCIEVLKSMPDNSVDFSIYSPPFASLYTYSNSERDMGNCRSDEEFFTQYRFMTKELYRVIKPGRLISVHCQNFPLMKERDGVIGLKDFRGDLIRTHCADGFIYHSEVCIWKDPVQAMQRTKAIGLLHKQLEKDSAMSRQAIPDYLVTFRKPGVNAEPIAGGLTQYVGTDDITVAETYGKVKPNAKNRHDMGKFQTDAKRLSIEIWQRYASPVWMDINPSDTLQRESAREEKDERHICPLQLEVIRRAMALWTNPNDVVLSPFAGIGSEGVVALRAGRRFIGAELKCSYFNQASINLRNAEISSTQMSIFDMEEL